MRHRRLKRCVCALLRLPVGARATCRRPHYRMHAGWTLGWLAWVLAVSACAEAVPARETIIVNTLTEAEMNYLRTRPALTAEKYRVMASDRYAFFRGTVPLYLRDATDPSLPVSPTNFAVPGAVPLSMGDPHPENFGLLVASDGTFAVEGNDFDSADRFPYSWELRRLCTGMVLAARLANAEDPARAAVSSAAARRVAFDAARTYANTMRGLAAGVEAPRFTGQSDSPIVEDLFERGREDFARKKELDELTVLEDGARKLRRGPLDPADPTSAYRELPAFALDVLPATLASYRDTLLAPPPASFFEVLDAVRELGSGVASIPRLRIILLVRGPTDDPADDVLLELKELTDSGARGFLGVGVSFDSVEDRVLGAARSLWARPDAEPFWGTSTLLGLPVQIKLESEGLKTIRVRRLSGALGEPEALSQLARLLGALLARMHGAADRDVATAIAATLEDDVDGFAFEHAEAGAAYADQVERDWQHFKDALERLGDNLGVRSDPVDRLSPELAALFGDP